MDQYTIYLLIAPIAAAMTFLLATYTLRNAKDNLGAQILTLYLLVVTGLVVFNALELVNPTPAGTIFWAKSSYLFITATPVIWFTFILHYTNQAHWLRKKWYLLFWLPPAITTAFAITNDWHGLVWKEVAFTPVHQFLAMRVVHGAAFWLFALFGYSLYISGTLIVLRQFLPSARIYRVQSKWLLLGSVTPLAANLVYLFKLIPGLTKDYTPIVFALAGIFFAVAMFKHRLFDLTPVARAALIENMSDGVLVFDLQGRLVDINPAGERIFAAHHRLKTGERLMDQLSLGQASSNVLQIPGQDGDCYYQIRRTRLTAEKGKQTGDLVVLRDVTEQTKDRQALERIRLELEERVRERTAELQALNVSLEARVKMRTRFLSAVYEVLSLVSSAGEKEEMLNRALRVVQQAVEADAAMIHLEGEGECLQLVAQSGLTPGEQASVARDAPWKALAQRSQPWESARDPLDGFVFPHAIAAPIRIKEHSTGLLTVLCRKLPEWEAADVNLIAAVAEQIGVGLEMQRLHEQEKEVAIQHERARLARDLHDSVMQLLYSQSLFFDAAQTSIRQNRPEQAGQYIDRVREIAEQSVREMRLLIYQLRPAALSHGGLRHALQNRLELVEQRAGLLVDFDYEMDAPAIPEAVEIAVYRVVEEALNNTLKHAHAKSVSVAVRQSGAMITLRVRDDGDGFDPQTVRPGLGLGSMRERVENVRGALEIHSAAGAGAQITASIPFSPEPAHRG